MNSAFMAALAVLMPLMAVSAADRQKPSEIVATGRAIYDQYCASCHGAEGEGAPDWREPNAAGELPAPPHGPDGHTWRHSDAALTDMISNGWRDPFNQTDRLTMPPFEAVLTPQEIKSVVAYLKTLWTPEQRRFQAEEARGGPSMSDALPSTPQVPQGESDEVFVFQPFHGVRSSR